MAAKKKTAKADKPVTKTGFIKTFAPTVSADEIVAKGKDAGLDLTKKFIWTLQSEMRKAAAKTPAKSSKAKPAKAKAAPAKVAPATKSVAVKAPVPTVVRSSSNATEQKMRALIIELGTARAEEIYKSVRAQLSAIAGQP